MPLRPGVYQSMMKATLYPIKCVMDEASSVVDRGQLPGQTLQLEGEASKFYFLELLSICERLTAFAYTGNARVLLSALGKTLWFGRALQDGLYPCFNPSVVKFVEAGGSVAIDHRHWPTDASGRSPLRSSERCHECTYGAMFTRVSAFVIISRVALCFNYRPGAANSSFGVPETSLNLDAPEPYYTFGFRE